MNPLQPTNGGTLDAFVAKIAPKGTALVYSTYLGGSLDDTAQSIAIDSSGNAFISGETNSSNFPTMNALQPANAGGYDVFVAQLNPLGSALVYSTYLGGSGDEWGYGVAIDSTGKTYVAGQTTSSNFPTLTPLQPANGGGNSDAFVTKLPSSPSAKLSPASLAFPTQVVFTSSKTKTAILTNTGVGTLNITNIAISGPFSQTNTCASTLTSGSSCTFSVTFNPTTIGALIGTLAVTDNATGNSQKVTLSGTGTYIQLTPIGLSFGNQPVGTTSLPKKITLSNKGSVSVSITSTSLTGTNAGDFAETNTCGSSVAAGASCFITVTFTPSATGKRSASVAVSDSGGGSPQNVTLAGTGT